VIGTFWVIPKPLEISGFPAFREAFPVAVPSLLTGWFVLPRALSSSSELSLHRPPAVSKCPESLRIPNAPTRAPSWGFGFLFATSAGDVHWVIEVPDFDLTFRPQRFARSRRLAPSPALRACFIPLPR
jgi:hypothetical protein